MYSRILGVLWICLIAVLLIVTTTAGDKINLKKTHRIVNGENKTIEELPFIVQIRDPRVGSFCGGSLISNQHVLTAAHCFEPPNNGFKTVTVVAGATMRSEAGESRNIESVTLHPEYENFYVDKGTRMEKKVGSKADVAIIKLKAPFVESDKIKVMRNLCDDPPTDKDVLQVSGWGHTKQINPLSAEDVKWAFAEQLQSVRLPVISNENCAQRLSGDGLRFSDTNVCAYEVEHDSCISDSGGPGISRGKLCAVVSYGIGCAYGEYPGVYTTVSSIRKFINDNVNA